MRYSTCSNASPPWFWTMLVMFWTLNCCLPGHGKPLFWDGKMNFMLMMNSYLYKFKTFSPANWLESNWIDVNFFSFCGSISDSQKIYIFTCIFFVWKDGVSKVSCWAMLIEISSLHLTRPPWGCSPWRCPHRPLLRWSFCPAHNCNLRGVLALELTLITS